jgi:DUF1365 family protein
MPSVPWPILGAVALLAIPLSLAALLPAYAMTLAVVTMLRARWRLTAATTRGGVDDDGDDDDAGVEGRPPPWGRACTSFFRGRVYHVRHGPPVVHSFGYPLHFAYVDLDESSDLFGSARVRQEDCADRRDSRRRCRPPPDDALGSLWPLSSLLSLSDDHHLKNGEGEGSGGGLSMRERITNLVRERTRGALDLRATDRSPSGRRRIVLVTHLSYYGYCFNPVSFFFVLRPGAGQRDGRRGGGGGGGGESEEEEEEDVEAVVVEVSNTPWNEMHVYVLHPDSVDTAEYLAIPPRGRGGGSPPSPGDDGDDDDDDNDGMRSRTTHRYRWRKGFHVSPFMTMDHDYDWRFQVGRDRIRVEARMIRRGRHGRDAPAMTGGGGGDADATTSTTGAAGDGGGDADADADGTTSSSSAGGDGGSGDERDEDDGKLYFTAGFDVRRAARPTWTYPLQLARVVARFPIYCLVIQLWIHYEALRLLIKGVEFVPHPGGSETGASRAIAALAGPALRAKDAASGWWSRRRRGAGRIGKSKSA